MDAYHEFYSRRHQRLFLYLVRMTGDAALAADLTQEAFRRHIEHYGMSDLSAPLLYRIARNALFDHHRTRKQWVGINPDEADESASPEDTVLIREEYQRVLKAMAGLAMDERDLLGMVLTGDLTYSEIASLTGLSVSNIKVKIHRARRKLRDILAKN